ncbi:succinylglutamate desuccinylase/aspartoacylase family protein [Chondrinema litorale]|uniref:succinylglutamate desuccinylase/aspartoacylase family protein n=1 Tax=Chondrinema litorale TaxID=2994555 RepID=UPI002542A53C|nr:succinylglutamate desuccinylase/aspartoacylase family protein [Chondrinema litorale]UZR98560.1 succinylglutamate desuccinylase/aspartoacylase family protein [Chondrinema litorale]
MNTKGLIILGESILPGESKKLNLNMARLFTNTLVEVPVYVESAKLPGPTVLITSGIHGDEINGMEIVRQVISKKINIPKRGTIICIPVINVFGFINMSRTFPDGRDLNRVFPGSVKGSLASRFAHHFVSGILPNIDLCLDFHTGGGQRLNASQIRIEQGNEELKKYADIFHAPFTVYSKNIPKSFRSTCKKMGIPILLNESCKALQSDKTMAKNAVGGIMRILAHLDMLNKKFTAPDPQHKNIVITTTKWIRASRSGFLHPKIAIHDFVNKGDVIATIVSPYGDSRHVIKAPNDGYVINVNEAPMIYQGDAIFHISTKLEKD